MGTTRISRFESGPATTFTLEADHVETQASYGSNGRWRLRGYIKAVVGPGGSTGSYFGGTGTHQGRFNGSAFRTRTQTPFMPSGYANGATRWYDGPYDIWVNANSNGYWSGSSTTYPVQMWLDYSGHTGLHSGSLPLPRIARAPGAAGQPTISDITPTSATFTWTAAARGNSNIDQYQWQVSTSSTFTTVLHTETLGVVLTDSTIGDIVLTPGTTYYVRVRAHNGDGYGAYSATRSFVTLPSTPPGMTITPQPTGSSASIALTPPSGISGVDKYTVHWSYISPLPVPTPSSWSQDTVTTPVLISGLIPGAVYSWTATATIGTYTSVASDPQALPQPQPSTNPGEYFDGSTPAQTDTSFAWTGTVNNSTSTQSASGVEGWEVEVVGAGEATLMRATGGFAGSYSARVTVNADLDVAAPSMRIGLQNADPFRTEIESDTLYVGSIYVNPSRQQRLACEITWVTAGGALVSRSVGTGILCSPNIWQRLTVADDAPSTALYGMVKLVDVAGSGWSQIVGGDVFLTDAAMLSLGELFSYFDGATPDTTNYRYDWLGTANASQSTRTTLEVTEDPLADPDCPPIPPSPRPPIVPSDCIEDVGVWRRYWAYIPPAVVADWLTTIPTLELETGFDATRQVRVRVYPNPFNRGSEQIDTSDYCSEQIISYIPPITVMTLDGVTERVWAEVQGGPPISADHLLYGSNGTPAVWPHLSCGIPYWVSFDVPVDAPSGNLTTRVYVTQRT